VVGFPALDPHDRTPIYVQVDRAIRAAIQTGRLPAGAQLPTVRQLAVDLRVNANTIARVYVDLERAGIVETRRGVGTFVAGSQPSAGPRRGRDPELRALVQRCLDEAAARGFSADDVVRQLMQLATRQGG
jgi:GntR family transcriptional regulator